MGTTHGGGSDDGPLLTIALPTYNRAALLEQQLGWLAAELASVPTARCEVLISDNRSTDATPEVIQRWSQGLDDQRVRTQRHARNVGAVPNIFSCIQGATGRFVWTISDDDPIEKGTLAFLLEVLTDSPDLELVILNFSMKLASTGEYLYDRCFEIDEDVHVPRGRAIFSRLLTPRPPFRWGGLVLTSALVYRSETARAMFSWWPESFENLNAQLVISAYCAATGETLVTAESHLECTGGDHHWMQNDRRFFKFVVPDYAESFLKLTELGYDPRLCRRKILEQLTYVSRRLTVRCAVRYPVFTTRMAGRYLRALWRSHQQVRRSVSPP
jgi:abequosyltransferase